MSSKNIVKLDIGGTVFKTSESTLTKFDGMFRRMLRADVPIKKDESGRIFIDRDPLHFRLILNYMRDGYVELPDTRQELKEIETEAKHYRLKGLEYLCDAKMPVKTEFSNNIRVIRSDAEFFQITRDPIKPVLVFHRSSCSDGSYSYPAGFKVNSFLEKHEHHLDIYFKSFLSPRMPWHWTFHKNSYKCESYWAARFGGTFTSTIEKAIDDFFDKFPSIE